MSQKEVVVDLTAETDKPKKMKQMRLPFAPLQKHVENKASSGDTKRESPTKKRKHSSDGEDEKTKKTIILDDGQNEQDKVLKVKIGKKSQEAKVSKDKSPLKANVIKEKSPLKANVIKEKSPLKVEETKVKETKSKEPKSKETKSKETKVKETKSKETKVKETKSKETKVKETKSKEKKVKETKPKEIKVKATEEIKVKATEEIKVKATEEVKVKETEPKEIKVKEAMEKEDILKEPNEEDVEKEKDEPMVEEKTLDTSSVCSPNVIEDRRRRVQVEIAKIVVTLHEANDELEDAVKKQEFLLAQQIKDKISKANERKDKLQLALDKGDPEELRTAVPTPTTILKTPCRKRSVVVVKTPGSSANSDLDSGSCKVKKLTPKQEARKAEFDRKREEKERQKEEARKARDEEKAKREAQKEVERKEKETLREKEKEEREKARLEKEKMKQEKEEERLKRKKEKEELKELEKKQKEEEAKKKQEEKEKKEEERKKQEELEKQKVAKTSKTFVNFFVVKKPGKEEEKTKEATCQNNNLNQFQVKSNMRMAPVTRTNLGQEGVEKLDTMLNKYEGKKQLYILNNLAKPGFEPAKTGKTWPWQSKKEDEDDDDIEILDDDEEEESFIGDAQDEQDEVSSNKGTLKTTVKAKLLQFHENQRPPYWGTWTKKSSRVGPRRPFAHDSHYFDYDYDSDDDWEEEEQGESLSDEEKDKEEDEEQEEDNEDNEDGFFVGHGVLDKDEVHAGDDESDGDVYDEELEMKKQKLRAQQFEEEYKKKKPHKLKPRVFGCFWRDPSKLNQNGDNDDAKERIVYEQLIKILSPYRGMLLCNGPIATAQSTPSASPTSLGTPECGGTPATTSASTTGEVGRPRKVFPEPAMPDLIRLVHANPNNKVFLAKEFLEFWKKEHPANAVDPAATPKSATTNEIPRSKVVSKISEIADYQRLDALARKCWVVKPEIVEKYEVKDLEVPNNWTYVLEQPKKLTSTPLASSASTPMKDGSSTPKGESVLASPSKTSRPSPASLITKFTKVLTQEERQRQIKAAAEKAEKEKLLREKEKLLKEKEKLLKEKEKNAANNSSPMIAVKKSPMIAVKKSPMIAVKKKVQPTIIDLTGNDSKDDHK